MFFCISIQKIFFFLKPILSYNNNDIENYKTKNNSKFLLKYNMIFVVKLISNHLDDVKLNYTDNFGMKKQYKEYIKK